MDLKNIKKFIELAKDEGVTKLSYEEKNIKISVSFESGASVVSHLPLVPETVGTIGNKSTSDGLHEIKSPFVGTFYVKSSPDKPAYVKVGDIISDGQTLCILEAMKIMNEIESDKSGEIVEVCVENESLVEFGQTLFKIRVG